MNIITNTSIQDKLQRAIKPLNNFLFPKLNQKEKAYHFISLNMVTNLLGLGNAATPAGLKAIEEMNMENKERGSSGISVLWPKTNNQYFKDALQKAHNGESPNNISPIIKYSLENGVKILWFGDLEKDFMENIKDDLEIEEADIIFAPHHGRYSGKIPNEILEKINPKIIIIGEAPSSNLNYYSGYNTITQNSAGDITFECEQNNVHIYVSNENYSVPFLKNKYKANDYDYYIGTLEV